MSLFSDMAVFVTLRCEKCSAVLMEIIEMMKVMDDLLFGHCGFAPSLSLCLCGIAVCFCGLVLLFGNGFDFLLTLSLGLCRFFFVFAIELFWLFVVVVAVIVALASTGRTVFLLFLMSRKEFEMLEVF